MTYYRRPRETRKKFPRHLLDRIMRVVEQHHQMNAGQRTDAVMRAEQSIRHRGIGRDAVIVLEHYIFNATNDPRNTVCLVDCAATQLSRFDSPGPANKTPEELDAEDAATVAFLKAAGDLAAKGIYWDDFEYVSRLVAEARKTIRRYGTRAAFGALELLPSEASGRIGGVLFGDEAVDLFTETAQKLKLYWDEIHEYQEGDYRERIAQSSEESRLRAEARKARRA